MANAHNGLIRSLNAIYLQCEHVHEPKDIKDFVFYIKVWGDTVHHHHHGEETNLFPQLDVLANEAGIPGSPMTANIEQHREFDKGLHQLNEYSAEILAGTKQYDSKLVKAYIDGFGPILTDHLHCEIKTLLSLEVCDGAKLKKAFNDMVKGSFKTAVVVGFLRDALLMVLLIDCYLQSTMLPLAFGSWDKTCPGSQNFPVVPFFVPYMSAYLFSRKYKSVWRFNPCDAWSRPRPLHFLGPEHQ